MSDHIKLLPKHRNDSMKDMDEELTESEQEEICKRPHTNDANECVFESQNSFSSSCGGDICDDDIVIEEEDPEEDCTEPIPLWLQASDLYQSTLESGLILHAESFKNTPYIRADSSISNYSDFVSVMSCVDYWGVYDWPMSIYDFIISHIVVVHRLKLDL